MSSFTFYDATIVPALSAFKTMDHILHEAEKHPDAATFPTARLAEDMYPLTYQIHISSKLTEQMVARLTGREAANFEDNLSSYEEMHERIATILKILDAEDKGIVNRVAEKVEATTIGPLNTEMSNWGYSAAFIIPNIFFHLTIAYAILRGKGVPLGKKDYLKEFLTPHLPESAGRPWQKKA
ncbi:hypothetical protein N7532_011629 [Penicillium argentinense]|uniref:DUF1993 domain-containing protein n=1 Tax=Penicillium argentinense TaxID=1131581 RepID=A0A9W9EJ00_9EURO|nr:uncharacterized protein N7532_011629 [Penicillium argentinense]KAJ5082586.1 hypothetical protein N7532_011629 [Penicillium argentinense]